MGGVGWGMLTSYSRCVDGLGGVGHVNVMFMVRGNFEKEHVAACCSRVLTLKQQRAKKGDYQHVPFHANIKNIANTNKKNSPSYYTTNGSKNSTFPLQKNNGFHEMCYFVWENKKIRNFEKEHVAAGWWSWSNNEQKKADYQHMPFHANVKIHCKYQ